ncbi:putative MobA-like protein [Desulfosporosinus orientis DSM 765]|uniref:Putative MobA-like protein n=1 Tax=Desulfosporosinus orientis (strain ATCC 19365 / DSM 765 / NCIMB 8382 / VKM B-1628 / Singapore I) TaxID=768706 RepID=G7W9H6_DESOD|nr:nucleotidyltransferase family protein [Desulfosporosinus orientis]AET69893.1 putative MobA-like protein [Desulfosporosinus orientis DSM 765]
MKINGIILAAGLSSRMQAFKPLLKLQNKTVIESCIDSMLKAGAGQVILVLGYRAEEVEAYLADKYARSRLKLAYNQNYAETDMLTSIKIGVSALKPCDAFYLLPGDMPAIHPETFRAVKEAMLRTQALAAFPAIDGKRKHPPLISWQCRDLILNFTGEGGLREVWKTLEDRVATVPVEDLGCLMDTDTKEDYHKLVNYLADQHSIPGEYIL